MASSLGLGGDQVERGATRGRQQATAICTHFSQSVSIDSERGLSSRTLATAGNLSKHTAWLWTARRLSI